MRMERDQVCDSRSFQRDVIGFPLLPQPHSGTWFSKKPASSPSTGKAGWLAFALFRGFGAAVGPCAWAWPKGTGEGWRGEGRVKLV